MVCGINKTMKAMEYPEAAATRPERRTEMCDISAQSPTVASAPRGVLVHFPGSTCVRKERKRKWMIYSIHLIYFIIETFLGILNQT